MSWEMDVYPVRYELDFEDLKASEGYNPPDDFLIWELPLDAGGALPGREKTRERLWYEYPSPFEKDEWDLPLQEETERELRNEEERVLQILAQKECRAQQLEVEMLQQRLVERESQRLYQEEKQRRRQSKSQLRRQDGNQRRRVDKFVDQQRPQRLEAMRLLRQRLEAMQLQLVDKMQLQRLLKMEKLEKMQLQTLNRMHEVPLSRRLWQHLEDKWHQLQHDQDVLYFDEMWANSLTSECWLPDDETPTRSSSPSARDAHEEHQFHVEERQFHVQEHQVHVQIFESDAANIPRCRLFKSEANTQELLLESPLKIPYYIYAGRCNLKVESYVLRYADLFPNFHRWNFNWMHPTTYEGDNQFVDFFAELMGEAEYINTKERVLAKAIAIANKSFRKMLYFQIELAVEDCMMLLEDEEKFEQRWSIYAYIASEIFFKHKNYESVLEEIRNGHEGLRYELTELGSDANEDDALEMREFVDHLVRSTPIELPSTTKSDDMYKKWVSNKINLQFPSVFNLYVNYLVEKINMAQDLELAPKETS